MPDAVDELPREAGAYILLIRLDSALHLDMAAFSGKSLGPGLYVYRGSAYGPGGVRARVSRHLRADKPMRWHVDRLTACGQIERVGVRIGGRECDLVSELILHRGLPMLPGFDSSDSRASPAHLLRLPNGGNLSVDIFDLAVPGQ